MKKRQSIYFLENNFVGLRGFEREDLPLFKGWLCDPAVTQYLEMGVKPYTELDLEAVYKESAENSNAVVFTLCDLKTGEAIGTAGFYLINWAGRRAQYRILIGNSEYLGKGIGTDVNKMLVEYGFNRLNFNTIYLGVNADNAGAIHSYKKAGFTEEGRQREFVYNNGKYYDSIVMSILAREYKGDAA